MCSGWPRDMPTGSRRHRRLHDDPPRDRSICLRDAGYPIDGVEVRLAPPAHDTGESRSAGRIHASATSTTRRQPRTDARRVVAHRRPSGRSPGRVRPHRRSAKDMVIVGGQRVPAEIEHVLAARRCRGGAAVGDPDERPARSSSPSSRVNDPPPEPETLLRWSTTGWPLKVPGACGSWIVPPGRLGKIAKQALRERASSWLAGCNSRRPVAVIMWR